MKESSKTPKKATRSGKHKAAKRRTFPYAEVAKMWAQGAKLPTIAKEIDRVGKGHDKFHALRVFLTKMHKGYPDAEGNIVKLPYRVSPKTVKRAIEAGRRASA